MSIDFRLAVMIYLVLEGLDSGRNGQYYFDGNNNIFFSLTCLHCRLSDKILPLICYRYTYNIKKNINIINIYQ